MSLIVQKYGGSSVANIDRIESVAERITRAREYGDRIIVVVSAMAGETNRLLDLARAVSHPNRPNPRELDALLSTGETTACTLLCMALEKRGVTARSLHAGQAGIHSRGSHFRARINDIDFYNDSKSTTPAATHAAIQKLNGKPILLFLGGLGKNTDRSPLIMYYEHGFLSLESEN